MMSISYAFPLERSAVAMGCNWLFRREHLNRLLCNPWTLLLCKLIIGVVSAYDIFLTIKYVESLPMMELNPIGRWLMMLDNQTTCQLSQIAAFIASKFAGNFLALCVIELLASWKPRMSTAVALSVALIQLWLLHFLVFGDTR
jgi:hypothetical protein